MPLCKGLEGFFKSWTIFPIKKICLQATQLRKIECSKAKQIEISESIN